MPQDDDSVEIESPQAEADDEDKPTATVSPPSPDHTESRVNDSAVSVQDDPEGGDAPEPLSPPTEPEAVSPLSQSPRSLQDDGEAVTVSADPSTQVDDPPATITPTDQKTEKAEDSKPALSQGTLDQQSDELEAPQQQQQQEEEKQQQPEQQQQEQEREQELQQEQRSEQRSEQQQEEKPQQQQQQQQHQHQDQEQEQEEEGYSADEFTQDTTPAEPAQSDPSSDPAPAIVPSSDASIPVLRTTASQSGTWSQHSLPPAERIENRRTMSVKSEASATLMKLHEVEDALDVQASPLPSDLTPDAYSDVDDEIGEVPELPHTPRSVDRL